MIRYYDSPQGTSYGIGAGGPDEWSAAGFQDVTPKVHAYLQSQGHDTDFPPIYYNPERKLFANYAGRGAFTLQSDPKITPVDNTPFWANWLETFSAAMKGWIVPLTVSSLGGTNFLTEAGASLAGETTAYTVAPEIAAEVTTEGVTNLIDPTDFVGDLPLADDLAYTSLPDASSLIDLENYVGDIPIAGDPTPIIEVAPGGAADMGQVDGVWSYERPPYSASDFLRDAGQVVNTGLKGAQLYQELTSTRRALTSGSAPAVAGGGRSSPTGAVPGATGLVSRPASPVVLDSPESRLRTMSPTGSNIVPKNSASASPIGALAGVALVLGLAYYWS